MVREEIADSFRLFELLEPFLYQPEVFREQTIIQFPGPERLIMVEKYYELDDLGKSTTLCCLYAQRNDSGW